MTRSVILMARREGAIVPDGIVVDFTTPAVYLDGEPLVTSPIKVKVLAALLARSPELISIRDLIDYVYDDEDGGPLNVDGCVRTSLSRLRAPIAKIGFEFRSSYGRGIGIARFPERCARVSYCAPAIGALQVAL